MGLFDKKYCDLCGKKIGLLGNNKLQDGNMCNDCEKKLAVWFKDHRNTSVAQIKEQLKDREDNAQMLSRFRPNKELGVDDKFIKIDESLGRFVILREGESMNKNPELLELNKVRNVRMEIKEETSELHYKDAQGHMKSYNPKHFKYHYRFLMHMDYDGKWFRELSFPLALSTVNGGEDGQNYTGMAQGTSIGSQFLSQMGFNTGFGNTTYSGNTFGRTDLPGGYRQGLTSMRPIDIEKYQNLERLGNEIIQYFMGGQMNQFAQTMNPYGQQPNQFNGQMNQGYMQQPNQFGGQMNQGFMQQPNQFNGQMNQGYANPQMNQGYGQQPNQFNSQMNQSYANPQMNQGYGQQQNQFNGQMNQGYGNPQMNQGFGQNASQENPQNMNAGFSQQAGGRWTCSCGAENTGQFCEFCGSPRQ